MTAKCIDQGKLDGRWRVEKLYPELQEIITKYPESFGGVDPYDENKEEES